MVNISLIIPIYNAELFLEKCLDSVVNQSVKDIEIILINDGSSDRSLEICKQYAHKDERIIIINQENKGVSVARNQGIKIATGKYLAFVDADDWIERNYCEIILDKINDKEYDLILFNSYEHKDNYINKTIIFDEDIKVFNEDNKLLISMLMNPYRFRQKGNNILIGGPIAKLYNRNFMIENNILFDTNILIHEDDLLNLIFIRKATNILYVNEQLYHIRRNEFSTTRRFMPLGRENIEKTIKTYKDTFKKLEIPEEYYEFLNERIIGLLIILNSVYFSNKGNPKNFYLKKYELKKFIIENEIDKIFNNVNINNLDKKRRLAVKILSYRLYGIFLILTQGNTYIKSLKNKKSKNI